MCNMYNNGIFELIFFTDKASGAPALPSATYSTMARGSGTAVSTASSAVSVANLHFLPVKTQTTLKSPLEGHNLGPFHKPEEFLQRTIDNLAHEAWEDNVSGMAHVLRFARHHSDYLLVEYKPLLQHVMKHVKNLRSQVKIKGIPDKDPSLTNILPRPPCCKRSVDDPRVL